jgi:hypothetical protein
MPIAHKRTIKIKKLHELGAILEIQKSWKRYKEQKNNNCEIPTHNNDRMNMRVHYFIDDILNIPQNLVEKYSLRRSFTSHNKIQEYETLLLNHQSLSAQKLDLLEAYKHDNITQYQKALEEHDKTIHHYDNSKRASKDETIHNHPNGKVSNDKIIFIGV